MRVCSECSITEGIPTIKKPSEEQLGRADERYSVRERMERMAGTRRDSSHVSDEQMKVQGNLARLRMPEKKQYHPEVLDDYYWNLNISRRRKKLSINQLSLLTSIPAETIKQIEKGKIPENFEETFLKLESFLAIKLLKHHKQKINFTRSEDEQKAIISAVRRRIDNLSTNEDEIFIEEMKEKKEALERISKGEADFSDRKDLTNVTLNDLVEMKRQREKKENKRRTRIQTDAMLGDDLDIEDLEEL